MADDYYIATLGHLLGLSRASSCRVRWARANAFSSPIITKCLTPCEDIPATAPRAICWIHWTSQQHHDAGNESANSTNHAMYIIDNGQFDWYFGLKSHIFPGCRIQPDIVTDKELSRAAKCPTLAAMPGFAL